MLVCRPRLAATVTEPSSGLCLEVLTTTPGMQFYTGGFLGPRWSDGKDGAVYPRFGGLCLEAQVCVDVCGCVWGVALVPPGVFLSWALTACSL